MADERIKFDENGDLLISSREILRVFSISNATRDLWAKQGCPKVERGWWKLSDVIRWRGIGNRLDRDEESDEAKKLRADAEYKDMKAKQEAVKLQEMLGNLVPIDMIQEEWAMTFTEIRQQLLKLPNDIRARIYTLYPECSEDVTLIAKETVRQCLDELAGCSNAGIARKMEDSSDGEDDDGEDAV